MNGIASPDGGALIRVSGLRKTYQMGQIAVHALAGIDATIEDGSFTVVMGPSGSGKSTLLHLIGGLDRSSGGQIIVGGRQVSELNENELALYRREVAGFVFQSFNLVASMTALENVAFPLRFVGMPRRERRLRALDLLQRVGLGDRVYHRPSELSGGQQQRVAIARALANDPSIILADEPTGNLDTTSSAEVLRLLTDLHEAGRTVVVVTHDLRIRGFATHTIFLLDGSIVSEDTYLAASTLLLDGENTNET
jgi:putative ABC transport system ATP-binding protein